MQRERYAIVVTTINNPTAAVQSLAAGARRLSADFVIIGDSKSPPGFVQENARYLDLEAQLATGFRFAAVVPTRHYARKNIGYLEAIRSGATVIVETDDDNFPLEGFWEERRIDVEARRLDNAGWVNVYRYFSDATIWPRGLPLDRVQVKPPSLDAADVAVVRCPIQQGLANANPDVDAIYRLVLPLPINFTDAVPVALGDGSWCPFNSQNTSWWSEAFPLLYLPFHCSFRMTDIWRSFVAQRIAWENGWSILFHGATVYQERNDHSLMRDFGEEVVGYLRNSRLAASLAELVLHPGADAIPDNMRRCYQRLVEEGFVGVDELPLLDAWLADLAGLAVDNHDEGVSR